jgi:5-(carboxyamino)imidazole ribonucleotide synthase
MEKLVTSDFRLGIIAGGQLGKMLVLAASNWDVKTYILDNDEHCPASTVCTRFIKGDPLNYKDVYEFGKMVDMITFEIENVTIEPLVRLRNEGKPVRPDPAVLEIIQDKGLQKGFYRKHGIPTADFTLYESANEIAATLKNGSLTVPFVQKLRRGGYDGRGVAVIRTENDLSNLLDGPSVVERMIEVRYEISVIASRNLRGEVSCFPVAEMELNPDANLVERLICPSSLPEAVQAESAEMARRVINALEVVGILAVEMFVDEQGRVWVNESAPRPHNSGHHTIESVVTSQFEQLLRAIFNFSPGSTHIKLPSVMINLLGEPGYAGPVKYEGLTESMKVDGVKVHLYGKKETRPFRKMGHVTVVAPSVEEARRRADIIKNLLKVKSWQTP